MKPYGKTPGMAMAMPYNQGLPLAKPSCPLKDELPFVRTAPPRVKNHRHQISEPLGAAGSGARVAFAR